MAYCPNCGNQLAGVEAICSNCGHPQGAPVARAAGPVGAAPPQYGFRRTEGSAVAAMVLGILGIVMCPLVCSIPAVILGAQAKSRIEADPALDGEGMAKAGVILGWIGIGLGALGVVIFVLGFVLSAGSSVDF